MQFLTNENSNKWKDTISSINKWIFFSSEKPYILDYEYKKHWRLLLNWKGIPITKSLQLILLLISLSNF
jgi:hypothetical protein